jgi:hypothetical protein
MNTNLTSQSLPINRQVRQGTHRWNWIIRLVGIALLFVIMFVAYLLWRMNYVPADLDTSVTRRSEQAMYRGGYTARLDPIAINQMHTWVFHLASAAGQPLEEAHITVDGGMPQHGHGLPTSPQVTQALGNGDYLVEGMKFNMPGWWVVNFHITANGQRDTVTFNLILK